MALNRTHASAKVADREQFVTDKQTPEKRTKCGGVSLNPPYSSPSNVIPPKSIGFFCGPLDQILWKSVE